ncbi:MAG: aminodeoxychorismate synthase component I [Pseudomonadota bacterium]
MPILFELPYTEDCERLFESLACEPWAMWLDGAGWGSGRAVRGIFVAYPRVTLVSRGGETLIDAGPAGTRTSRRPPLEVLAEEMAALATDGELECLHGGAVGYFAYDLARREVPLRERDEMGVPDMALGLYDGMVVVDHARRVCEVRTLKTAHGRAWGERIRQALMRGSGGGRQAFELRGAIRSDMDYPAYARAFAAVQDYIRAGDCYQVNLAMRHAAPCMGHPWPLYQALRRRNPAPYAAWLNLPFAQVLSSSPECFLSVRGGAVTTRPIKGTRRRGATAVEDARLRAELAACTKDRAENLMIVDLLRNDLGRVCEVGSVRVPELFRIESYATVHHLVSTVTGRLAPGKTPLDLLAAAFPGGSITGAPKRRAMQVIDALEPSRRELYCGAIGYLDTTGDMELNIAIRTLVCNDGEVRYWAGGGLVADSQVGAEYQECLDKGRAMREVLEGFMGAPDARPPDSLTS